MQSELKSKQLLSVCFSIAIHSSDNFYGIKDKYVNGDVHAVTLLLKNLGYKVKLQLHDVKDLTYRIIDVPDESVWVSTLLLHQYELESIQVHLP